MDKVTIWFGAALVALGVGGFVGSGAESVTALIPSFIGAVLVALGFVAAQEGRRALAMHIAAVVALVGFLGSIMGVADLPDLIAGEDLERPWAVGVQSVMAVVLVVYLALLIKSFVDARRSGT
ncbi:MAG: hypothetical protein JJU45_02465 [Acidimicrobiia bacterium]|nr:hypothetical protein [Acidimicrobiia bacterium]